MYRENATIKSNVFDIMIGINPLIIVLLDLMERVIFFSSLNHSLSKIIIFIDVKMHIIFVTLARRY